MQSSYDVLELRMPGFQDLLKKAERKSYRIAELTTLLISVASIVAAVVLLGLVEAFSTGNGIPIILLLGVIMGNVVIIVETILEGPCPYDMGCAATTMHEFLYGKNYEQKMRASLSNKVLERDSRVLKLAKKAAEDGTLIRYRDFRIYSGPSLLYSWVRVKNNEEE